MKKAVRDIQNISLPKGMYRAVGVCALRKFGFFMLGLSFYPKMKISGLHFNLILYGT